MQGQRHRVSFPRICTPLRSLLICPRSQQCVFDQAPGVIPVRRETIEAIDGGRMQCAHPAGVQCGTRCQVETSRNSHMAAGCNACIRLVCDGWQAEAVSTACGAGCAPSPLGGSCGWALAEILHATLAQDASHGARLNFVTSAERSWCAPYLWGPSCGWAQAGSPEC